MNNPAFPHAKETGARPDAAAPLAKGARFFFNENPV